MKTAIPTTLRAKRQIGYGALGSGLAAGLSGISSGYGYGYNNGKTTFLFSHCPDRLTHRRPLD